MATMDNPRIRSQPKVLWSPRVPWVHGIEGYLGTFQGSLKGLTGKQIRQLLTPYRSRYGVSRYIISPPSLQGCVPTFLRI